MGPLQTTREALPLFGLEGGSVINISSIVSRMGIPDSAVYAGTKGALDTITQVLATELGPRKIRVNSINPGMVESEGTHTAGFIGGEFQKNVEAQAPLGRIGQPEDVAKVAVFLASDDSSWLTGERISASGGHR
jgi:3-oxoacyl-[acyl-carrier protein] reductase